MAHVYIYIYICMHRCDVSESLNSQRLIVRLNGGMRFCLMIRWIEYLILIFFSVTGGSKKLLVPIGSDPFIRINEMSDTCFCRAWLIHIIS